MIEYWPSDATQDIVPAAFDTDDASAGCSAGAGSSSDLVSSPLCGHRPLSPWASGPLLPGVQCPTTANTSSDPANEWAITHGSCVRPLTVQATRLCRRTPWTWRADLQLFEHINGDRFNSLPAGVPFTEEF